VHGCFERPVVALSDLANGDIVECVDDTPSRPESQIMPDLGGLYTITSIRPIDGGHSVRLKELAPTCFLGGVCACGHCGWDAGRFRKVYRPSGDLIASLTRKVCEPA
jgi:hypothetical protein